MNANLKAALQAVKELLENDPEYYQAFKKFLREYHLVTANRQAPGFFSADVHAEANDLVDLGMPEDQK